MRIAIEKDRWHRFRFVCWLQNCHLIWDHIKQPSIVSLIWCLYVKKLRNIMPHNQMKKQQNFGRNVNRPYWIHSSTVRLRYVETENAFIINIEIFCRLLKQVGILFPCTRHLKCGGLFKLAKVLACVGEAVFSLVYYTIQSLVWWNLIHHQNGISFLVK